jgi:hypothetical protein
VIVLALAAGAVFFISAPSRDEAKRRSNSLALAGEYLAQGEYQRALDILDRLLIADAGDQDARALRDEILRFRRLSAAAPEAEAPSVAEPAPPPPPAKQRGRRNGPPGKPLTPSGPRNRRRRASRRRNAAGRRRRSWPGNPRRSRRRCGRCRLWSPRDGRPLAGTT